MGEEVPENTPVKAEIPVENKKVEEIPVEVKDEPKKAETGITKTEINRMPITDLKKFAKANGIKNADAKNGADLKKELIEKLGL